MVPIPYPSWAWSGVPFPSKALGAAVPRELGGSECLLLSGSAVAGLVGTTSLLLGCSLWHVLGSAMGNVPLQIGAVW